MSAILSDRVVDLSEGRRFLSILRCERKCAAKEVIVSFDDIDSPRFIIDRGKEVPLPVTQSMTPGLWQTCPKLRRPPAQKGVEMWPDCPRCPEEAAD